MVWIDGPTLREIAESFPEARKSLRRWTLFNGVKEFMLENFKHATDEERKEAKEWVHHRSTTKLSGTTRVVRLSSSKNLGSGAGTDPKPTKKRVKTMSELHDSLHVAIEGRFAALEAKVDLLLSSGK